MVNPDAAIMAEAERKGRIQMEIDAANKVRAAQGKKPLPDYQEYLDMVSSMHVRKSAVAIDSRDVQKLYEMRASEMRASAPVGHTLAEIEAFVDGEAERAKPSKGRAKQKKAAKPSTPAEGGAESSPRPADPEEERAIREAESVRRVQDMKNGRINHIGTWSGLPGEKVEGGDATSMPAISGEPVQDKPLPFADRVDSDPLTVGDLRLLMHDMYERLRISFDGMERSLSDMQGRVMEMSAGLPKDFAKASAPDSGSGEDGDPSSGEAAFSRLIDRRTPVTFDVNGTCMTFDAVAVYHTSPCITVVSKADSATITPKPGSQLKLTYEVGGRRFEGDDVVYLGTRFDIPEFGLSFTGFIRVAEAGSEV